jgi:hypothetical protein
VKEGAGCHGKAQAGGGGAEACGYGVYMGVGGRHTERWAVVIVRLGIDSDAFARVWVCALYALLMRC